MNALVLRSLLAGVLLLSSVAPSFAAIALGPVDMNGFVSQGVIASDTNNYFGTTNSGEWRFTDLTVNLTYSPVDKLRLGAQMYVFQLGKYGDMVPILDWATVDYQPFTWLGVRAGRVKLPLGLHNEAIDLDIVRPFIFLPQGLYEARFRDLLAAFDGGSLYGNIPLSKAGSLDYNLFMGVTNPDARSGVGDFFGDRNPLIPEKFDIEKLLGYHFAYNTPVTGLKVGTSMVYIDDVQISGKTKNRQEFLNTPNGFRNLQGLSGAGLIPAGADASQFSSGLTVWTAFAEYSVNEWTFATEFAQKHARFTYTYPNIPALGANQINGSNRTIRQQTWYASVTKRITKWLELGAYYSMWWNDYDDQDGSVQGAASALPGSIAFDRGFFEQEDIALAARFDITSNWLIKAEVHKVNGSGLLFNIDGQNAIQDRDQDWYYFALKSSYSF